MKAIAIGLLADELGLTTHADITQGRNGPDLVRRHACWPADQYNGFQPARINLDVEHGRVVGQVVHLERRRGSGLWAVAVINNVENLPDVDTWYFSSAVDGTVEEGVAVRRNIQLTAVALTTKPASNAARPVQLLAGELRDVAQRPMQQLLGHQETLTRAAANKSGTNFINDIDRPDAQRPVPTAERTGLPARPAHRRPTRRRIDGEWVEINYRDNGRILGVY